jgi:hypothetical protein
MADDIRFVMALHTFFIQEHTNEIETPNKFEMVLYSDVEAIGNTRLWPIDALLERPFASMCPGEICLRKSHEVHT